MFDVPTLERMLIAFGPEGMLAVEDSKQFKAKNRKHEFLRKRALSIGKGLRESIKLHEPAVDIRTFIEDPYYLNMPDVFYPKVMEALVELNNGEYIEAVLTGGIGTGKTTVALATTAYQLYLLSLLKDPHKEFSIAPTDEIVFVFQSINEKTAKSVDYNRFRELIERSPYFNEKFQFNKELESELRFPKRIIVKPVSGQDTAAIGQNVIGGIIDEVNFMAVTQNSKQSHDGGVKDQAWDNYRAIVRRRESRFMKQGKMPGMLCLVSSKRYPGEFTEVKSNEALRQKQLTGKSTIFVYDKRVWDINPDKFKGEWFKVFTGSATRKPRMLEEDEMVPIEDRHLVIDVPIEYKTSFEQDILASLRDIAGVSTMALHPFIPNIEPVSNCFGTTKSILSRPDCNFKDTSVDVYPKRFYRVDSPRFIHIDLGLTSDSAGVACGYVSGFVKVQRGDDTYEILPNIVFDFVLEVKPPKNDEINFAKIREVLYTVRKLGLPLKWVTLDTYQSVDMIQILRSKGFIAGTQSLDTDNKGYEFTKTAFMDGRIQVPDHETAYEEFVHLERDPVKNRIDHPPKGSKDCSDAMAGVVYGLTMRREIWLDYNVEMEDIPMSIINPEGNVGKNSIESMEAKELMNE